MDTDKPLRIPAPLRHHVEQLFQFTDPFCGEHLDAEYAELIRKLIAKLARKRLCLPETSSSSRTLGIIEDLALAC